MDTMSRNLKAKRTVERFLPADSTLTPWCQPQFPNPKTPRNKPGIAATIPPPTLCHTVDYKRDGICMLLSRLEVANYEFQLKLLTRPAIPSRLDGCQPTPVWSAIEQVFR